MESFDDSIYCQIIQNQLVKEFEQINYQYSLKLKTPNIKLSSERSVWGTWDHSSRTISINKILIEKHSWDIVLDVFKHEIAHQYIMEKLNGSHLHDQQFRRVCDQLGLPKWARAASGQLPAGKIHNWRTSNLEPEQIRLLEKVEKLLALTQSPNEHESLIAMQKVRELQDKYRIESYDLAGSLKEEIVYTIMSRKKKRIPAYETLIFSILKEFYHVEAIFISQFDAKSLSEYKAVEITGARENVLMAEHVYEFLWRTIHQLWQTYKLQNQNPMHASAKRDYLLGVLHGFQSKLSRYENRTFQDTPYNSTKESPKEANQNAILAYEKDQALAIQAFCRGRHPKVSSRGWNNRCNSSSTYYAGVDQGRQIQIHRPVSGDSASKTKLLAP